MGSQRIGGIALLVVGVVLFMVGMNAKDSFADRWSKFFTGHFTDQTVWFMVGGLAAAIIGLMLVLAGRRA